MQDLHEDTFKTLSKNIKRLQLMRKYIPDKKTQYHKDINSSYFNLKFNVITPTKLLAVFLFFFFYRTHQI